MELAEKQAPVKDSAGPRWFLPVGKLKKYLHLLGLVLLGTTGLGWVFSFPTLKLLIVTFNGDIGLFKPGEMTNPVQQFFGGMPQLLWFGFIAGAALYFATQPRPAKPIVPQSYALTEWFGFAWRGLGVLALLAILGLAAAGRLEATRQLGTTDLVRTDYDEGVHAAAALLMARGNTIYKDFFLTQPPVAPLLWSLPLRMEGGEWAGLNDFLRLRLFSTLIALVTIGLAYITASKMGGKWGGVLAGSLTALALAIDGSAVRTEQQLMLEPVVNLFTVAALAAFVQYDPAYKRSYWLYIAGVFAGLALSVKVPALTVLLALGLSLLIWRRWRSLLIYGIGGLSGYLSLNIYFFITSGTDFIKQAYLYQLLRPFNDLSLAGGFQSETTLTAFDYLARTPQLAFTLLLAMGGLVAIVASWLTKSGAERWLPIVLLAALTCYLYTGKAGFFPHYYDHMVLPLALLGGGIINAWRLNWWSNKPLLAGGAIVGLGLVFVGWQAGQVATREPVRAEWSIERATATNFANLGLEKGTMLSWDARYSFIAGYPMPRDSYNKYMVDSAAYVEYLGLGLETQDLGTVAGRAFFKSKNEDLRQLRYTAAMQNNFLKTAENSDYLLLEPRADSQLTEDTRRKLKQLLANRLDSKEMSIFSNRWLIQRTTDYVFGEKMRLVGINSQYEVKTPGKVPLTFFWQAETKINEDYVIFVHLINEAGEKVAQRDTAPRNGARDTSQWQPGELFDDDQSLEIATNLPPGRYKVVTGVYNPGDGKRLAVSGTGNDSVVITEVTIVGL